MPDDRSNDLSGPGRDPAGRTPRRVPLPSPLDVARFAQEEEQVAREEERRQRRLVIAVAAVAGALSAVLAVLRAIS